MPKTVAICLLLSVLVAQGQTTYRTDTIAGSDNIGDNGPALQALLQQAEGIALDPGGVIYIADAANHRIRRIDSSNFITTIAGTGLPGLTGEGGPADVAQLNSPYGLALDATGNLYVADLGNHLIRRISPDGKIRTVAGGGSTPLSVLRDGQSAVSVALISPRNLALDADGSLVFSDFDAHRIARLSLSGALSIVAGTGLPGNLGDGGKANAAQLNNPAGLAFDASGNLYIADSANKKVRRITRAGVIDTVTALGGKPLSLTSPTGVALDATGTLFIADGASPQCLKVTPTGTATSIPLAARDLVARATTVWITGTHQVWQLTGATPKVIAGTGSGTFLGEQTQAVKARLGNPSGIAADASGNIYFADTANHRIRRIDSSGFITTIAGTGDPSFAGDNGPASLAQLKSPTAVALDSSGNLYLSDTGNHRIRRISRTGTIQTVAGTGTPGASGDGGLALSAQLSSPSGLAADRDGSLYIADTGNHCIRKLSPYGLIDTVAGTKTPGFSGDRGLASKAQFDSPSGIALDAKGQLLIADTRNHAIRRIDSSGFMTSVADVVPSRWNLPRGVATTPNGDIWVADTGKARLARVSSTGTVTFINSTQFNTVEAVLPEAAGTLLVSDSSTHRLYRLTPIAEDTAPPPALTTTPVTFQVVHSASYQTTSLAPGEIVTLFGANIGPAAATTNSTQFNTIQVLFDGVPGTLLYGRADQITVQVPYAMNGRASVEVALVANGTKRGSQQMPMAPTAPGLFTLSGGRGPAAALNQDGSLNSEKNPSTPGSIVTLYATGEGQTNPPSTDGRPAVAPYPVPLAPVSVFLDGQPCDILFAGQAPGLIGALQVNVRLPYSLTRFGALPITLVVGEAASAPGVTIAVTP